MNLLARRRRWLYYLSLTGLLIGCVAIAHAVLAQAAPSAPSAPSQTSATAFTVQESAFGSQNGARIERITYPSPVVTPYPANNLVTAYLFLPPGIGPFPAMAVLHEWAPSDTSAGFTLCRAVTDAHAAALLIIEPYSLNRRPRAPGAPSAVNLPGNVPLTISALHQAVLDTQRGPDYLSTRPDIDAKRLGIAGISLGGILSGVVAGVDPRIKIVVAVDGGAQTPAIIWNGLLTRLARSEIMRAGYTFESYRQAMRLVDADTWLPQRHFDAYYALMFNARYDVFVPPPQARALAADLGGAPIVWTATGHYGIIFEQNRIVALTTQFLDSRSAELALSGGKANVVAAEDFHAPANLPSRTIKVGLLLGGHEGFSPAAAYQIIDLDAAGRYSIDGQVTLHGIAGALSIRLAPLASIGLELPLLHGSVKPKPFLLLSTTI